MPHPRDDLPTALYSAAQVRDLDARLIAAGTPGFEPNPETSGFLASAELRSTHSGVSSPLRCCTPDYFAGILLAQSFSPKSQLIQCATL